MVDPVPGGTAPKVSVLMSVFNGLPYLEEAVESILAQSFANFEFVVVDDGSTDRSRDLLRRCAAFDPRFRLLDQRNTGLTAALVRAFGAARGELIARMDADDVSAPTRLEKQVAMLDARPDLVATACRHDRIGEDGRFLGPGSGKLDEHTGLFLQTFVNDFAHGSMMIRRSAYETVGGYRGEFRYAQDYDLWNRLLRLGPIGWVDEVLYRLRVRHDGISASNPAEQVALACRISRDSIAMLTGFRPDEHQIGKLRRFFGHGASARLSLADISFVHGQVRLVEKACLRVRGGRRARVAIHRLVADCWLNWFHRTGGDPLRARIALLARALAARPSLAARLPAARLARIARGQSRKPAG